MAEALCSIRVEDWRAPSSDDWRDHERGEPIRGWGTDIETPSAMLADTSVVTEEYKPRTELGRKLVALRKAIVASGAPLLSWEEIHEEIARRRGE